MATKTDDQTDDTAKTDDTTKTPEPKTDPKETAKADAGGKGDGGKADAKGGKGKDDGGKGDEPKDDDGDTDLDELGDRFNISKKALEKRLARSNSKALKAAFGTDDPEKIKELKAEHDRLKAADEESKRAALSEKERLEADLAKERGEKEDFKKKLAEMEEATTVDRQERAIRAIAKSYANPKYVRVAMQDFADYVDDMTEKELKNFGPDDAKKWFEGWVKENPELAKASEGGGDGKDGKGGKTEDPKKKVGVTSGKQGDKPAQGASGGTKKSVKDMTLKEVREHAASMGVKYPG